VIFELQGWKQAIEAASPQTYLFPSSAMASTVDRLESRNLLIRLRIESLEKKIPFLRPHEKWPSATAVRRYQERKSSSLASAKSSLSPAASQPNAQNAGEESSHPKGQDKDKDKDKKTIPPKLASFPFPVSGTKKSTKFPQFSRLPAE
jgi:hypothetical protein